MVKKCDIIQLGTKANYGYTLLGQMCCDLAGAAGLERPRFNRQSRPDWQTSLYHVASGHAPVTPSYDIDKNWISWHCECVAPDDAKYIWDKIKTSPDIAFVIKKAGYKEPDPAF